MMLKTFHTKDPHSFQSSLPPRIRSIVWLVLLAYFLFQMWSCKTTKHITKDHIKTDSVSVVRVDSIHKNVQDSVHETHDSTKYERVTEIEFDTSRVDTSHFFIGDPVGIGDHMGHILFRVSKITIKEHGEIKVNELVKVHSEDTSSKKTEGTSQVHRDQTTFKKDVVKSHLPVIIWLVPIGLLAFLIYRYRKQIPFIKNFV